MLYTTRETLAPVVDRLAAETMHGRPPPTEYSGITIVSATSLGAVGLVEHVWTRDPGEASGDFLAAACGAAAALGLHAVRFEGLAATRRTTADNVAPLRRPDPGGEAA